MQPHAMWRSGRSIDSNKATVRNPQLRGGSAPSQNPRGAEPLSDIFISYSSRHRDLTQRLADALEAQGYSVWWDRYLEAYMRFRDEIDAALSKARVVVVVWSDSAAASDYGRLVNTLAPGFDPARIPTPMREIHAVPVEDIEAVIRAIAMVWTGERPERVNSAEYYERATGEPALSTKRDTLTTVASSVSPASLLNARLALAPYLDTHGLRAGMGDWAREDRPVCADLRQAGWEAGFVETPEPDDANIHRQAIEGLIDSDRSPGLMLVLDYAERRQAEAARYAQRMLQAAKARPGRPLRLVLLTRSAGEWWDRAVAETPSLPPVFSGGVVAITPFTAVEDRERLFIEACHGFRAAVDEVRRAIPEAYRGWRLGEHRIPEDLQQNLATDTFARPLIIQIAALLQLVGDAPEATSVAVLLEEMLGLERKYWRAGLGATYSEPRIKALERGAVQVTLVGGATRADARALLLKDSHYTRRAPADVDEPLSDLQRIYGDGAVGVMALQPDLLGEHLVGMHLGDVDGDSVLIEACLDWAGEDQGRRRTILTVLQRATRGEHGPRSTKARAFLVHLVRTRGEALAADVIAVALETPGELPSVLEQAAPDLDVRTAHSLHGQIPPQTLRMARAALALIQRASADPDLTSEAGKATHAGNLHSLGVFLSAVGRREEALTATEQAVGAYRELVARNRDAFLPDLARSLSAMGDVLFALGRGTDAIEAYLESAEILQPFAEREPGAFGALFEQNLRNLVIAMRAAGRSNVDIADQVRRLGGDPNSFATRRGREAPAAHSPRLEISALKLHALVETPDYLAYTSPEASKFEAIRTRPKFRISLKLMAFPVLGALTFAGAAVFGPSMGVTVAQDVWNAVLDILEPRSLRLLRLELKRPLPTPPPDLSESRPAVPAQHVRQHEHSAQQGRAIIVGEIDQPRLLNEPAQLNEVPCTRSSLDRPGALVGPCARGLSSGGHLPRSSDRPVRRLKGGELCGVWCELERRSCLAGASPPRFQDQLP
eukprot:gene17417-17608_t